MDRRDSTIRLSEDVIDHNGVARFNIESNNVPSVDDVTIAPWINEPPPLPPKNNHTQRAGKPSFPFISSRQNSAASIRRGNRPSESQITLNTFESSNRRSADDGESARGIAYSGSSSTHSGDLRKAKSSLNLNIFGKLRNRTSKAHLKAESEDSEHPSLKPPVPPLPDGTALPIAQASSSRKRLKSNVSSAPPTKSHIPWAQEFTGDLDLGSMDGIVDFRLASNTSSTPLAGPSSPSSPGSYSDHHLSPEFSDPFSSSHRQHHNHERKASSSSSEPRKVSPKTTASPFTLSRYNHPLPPPPQPSPPSFSADSAMWVAPESWEVRDLKDTYNSPGRADLTEVPEAEGDNDLDSDDFALFTRAHHPHHHMYGYSRTHHHLGSKNVHRVNGSSHPDPLSLDPPFAPSSGRARNGSTGSKTAAGALPIPPPSGHSRQRQKGGSGSSNGLHGSSTSASGSGSLSFLPNASSSSNLNNTSIVSVSPPPMSFPTNHNNSSVTLHSSHPPTTAWPPASYQYKIRIHRQNSTYHVVAITPNSTVADINARLSKKNEHVHIMHNLYLVELQRERLLGPNESPAAIAKLRMEQAGYDFEDGHHLLPAEFLGMLVKFYWKSQLLAGEEEIQLENYDFVNLSHRALRTIPVILHQHADSIITLRLSRNPMTEIPLDFIQSCTTLRELRLDNMSMRKVPSNLRHSTTLHRLDLSGNLIKDLEESYLDQIPGLLTLSLQNNKLEKLPWYFPRMRSLVTLNLAGNRFKIFPLEVTHLTTLHELDISFNPISELPDEIGNLISLERLTMLNNRVSRFPKEVRGMVNLRVLDCRRNMIQDLGDVCTLESLVTLVAERNAVHGVNLVLGPKLTMLDVGFNDVTQISVPSFAQGSIPTSGSGSIQGSSTSISLSLSLPPPSPSRSYALTSLNLTYAKLSSIDDASLSLLTALRTLRLDHNSLRELPPSLCNLKWLETLSVTDNKLDALPKDIGSLQKLEVLDAHNNSLTEVPGGIWNCASLVRINVASNCLSGWGEPDEWVLGNSGADDSGMASAGLSAPVVSSGGSGGRKHSTASVNPPMIGGGGPGGGVLMSGGRRLPPLVYALEKLYLGENYLTDTSIHPLMILKELRILNLSFNLIQDLPPGFLRNMTQLEELYLSGNRLTSVPAEDFPRLGRLTTLFLNGNRLHTLPQELGKVANLCVLDVGSNFLKYNINNWEYEWNWNFNTNLKYLNLSGNKRLQIKADSPKNHRHSISSTRMLPGFTSLGQLRVLGLMDITITTTSKDTTVDIPDENLDRRIRTSLSTVCNMGYGIADSIGSNDTLTMIDLVHEFHHGRKDEAIFAMFGRAHPHRLPPGASPNKLSKFLHDKFVEVFLAQSACIDAKFDKEGVEPTLAARKKGIPKVLHWTFLKLNQDLWDSLKSSPRKGSQASMALGYGGASGGASGGSGGGGGAPGFIPSDSVYSKTGVSAVVCYFIDKTIFAANVGDALAVVSRQGVAQQLSRKHDPYDPTELARIRASEGFISQNGLVNESVDVSRSFGFYNLMPAINAAPEITVYDLSESDEFVIIANSGLWDFVPFQTGVDIARTVARTERPDPMLAAQKLRDLAISYGADGSVMIMVIWAQDLFTPPGGVGGGREREDSMLNVVEYIPKPVSGLNGPKEKVLLRARPELPPPTGHVTIVFTDIRNSTHLWEVNPGMRTARDLHNDLLRRGLRNCGGYEVKTEGDAFMCSFPTALSAVWWSLEVQAALLHADWPMEITECEDGQPRYDADGRLIASGLSVRMGIHCGTPICERDPITGRMDYLGPMVNRSSRISSVAIGGQIMCSLDVIKEINVKVFGKEEEETEHSNFQPKEAIEGIRNLGVSIIAAGEFRLKGIEHSEILCSIYPTGLEGRHELKEPTTQPTASTSRVQFSVPQMRELGMLCLRIEALSTGRVFRSLPIRKGSIQSAKSDGDERADGADGAETSPIFLADPELLLPPINDNSSDSDLMLVLDSLSIRIENAVNTIYQRLGLDPLPPSSSGEDLMAALSQDNVLDESTLAYISSILKQLS